MSILYRLVSIGLVWTNSFQHFQYWNITYRNFNANNGVLLQGHPAAWLSGNNVSTWGAVLLIDTGRKAVGWWCWWHSGGSVGDGGDSNSRESLEAIRCYDKVKLKSQRSYTCLSYKSYARRRHNQKASGGRKRLLNHHLELMKKWSSTLLNLFRHRRPVSDHLYFPTWRARVIWVVLYSTVPPAMV